MSYPQLTGRIGPSAAQGRTVLFAVLALAALIGVLAWRLVPRSVSTPPQAVAGPVKPPPEPPKLDLSDDQRLHLAHAEQQLVAAAEQLATARRVLAALGPALSRNYMDLEKRRVDGVWTACDAAQRAIEEARANINSVSNTRKD